MAPNAPGSGDSSNLTDLILHMPTSTPSTTITHANALAVGGENIVHVGDDEAVRSLPPTPHCTDDATMLLGVQVSPGSTTFAINSRSAANSYVRGSPIKRASIAADSLGER